MITFQEKHMALPAPFADLQKKFKDWQKTDLTPILSKFVAKHAKDEVEWDVVTLICPICESPTYYATATKVGKNEAHEVTCETCHSTGSTRAIECMDLIKIKHLKHVDRGPR